MGSGQIGVLAQTTASEHYGPVIVDLFSLNCVQPKLSWLRKRTDNRPDCHLLQCL
jgi:hypothetical protein